MDDHVSSKVSITMRNAISVNSHNNHQLERKVKKLEAERDMHLLNLQIERDEMVFGSPSARRKLVKSPTVFDGVGAGTPVSQQEMFKLNIGLHKDDEFTRFQKARNLPPLHLDQVGLIATPPRVRKAGMIRPPSSPNAVPQSPLEFPHKRLTRQSCSPQVSSTCSNSTVNAKDVRRENSTECKQQFSPRLLGSSANTLETRSTSSSVFKFDLGNNQVLQVPQRPATASASKDRGNEVHRGLLLRPVSSKEQTKAKEVKKESVFNRLYSSGNCKKRDVKFKVTREAPLPLGNPKVNVNTRRRSISLSDLTEILEKLKTCRYLRDSSQ